MTSSSLSEEQNKQQSIPVVDEILVIVSDEDDDEPLKAGRSAAGLSRDKDEKKDSGVSVVASSENSTNTPTSASDTPQSWEKTTTAPSSSQRGQTHSFVPASSGLLLSDSSCETASASALAAVGSFAILASADKRRRLSTPTSEPSTPPSTGCPTSADEGHQAEGEEEEDVSDQEQESRAAAPDCDRNPSPSPSYKARRKMKMLRSKSWRTRKKNEGAAAAATEAGSGPPINTNAASNAAAAAAPTDPENDQGKRRSSSSSSASSSRDQSPTSGAGCSPASESTSLRNRSLSPREKRPTRKKKKQSASKSVPKDPVEEGGSGVEQVDPVSRYFPTEAFSGGQQQQRQQDNGEKPQARGTSRRRGGYSSSRERDSPRLAVRDREKSLAGNHQGKVGRRKASSSNESLTHSTKPRSLRRTAAEAEEGPIIFHDEISSPEANQPAVVVLGRTKLGSIADESPLYEDDGSSLLVSSTSHRRPISKKLLDDDLALLPDVVAHTQVKKGSSSRRMDDDEDNGSEDNQQRRLLLLLRSDKNRLSKTNDDKEQEEEGAAKKGQEKRLTRITKARRKSPSSSSSSIRDRSNNEVTRARSQAHSTRNRNVPQPPLGSLPARHKRRPPRNDNHSPDDPRPIQELALLKKAPDVSSSRKPAVQRPRGRPRRRESPSQEEEDDDDVVVTEPPAFVVLPREDDDADNELGPIFEQSENEAKQGVEGDTGKDYYRSLDVPSYAKSYILPKVMPKESVEARKRQTLEALSHPPPRGKKRRDDAFKFSMLKTTLDYEGNLPNAHMSSMPHLRRLPSLEPGEAAAAATFDANNIQHILLAHHKKASSSSLSSRPRLALASAATASSGSSIASSQHHHHHHHKHHPTSVPCHGPGSLKTYIDYVQSSGFVPLPVLEPDKGVDLAIYAEHQNPDDRSDLESRASSYSHHSGGQNMSQFHGDITSQFERIKAHVEDSVRESDKLKISLHVPGLSNTKKRISREFEEMEGLSLDFGLDPKPKRGGAKGAAQKGKAKPKKRNSNKNNLMLLLEEDEEEEEEQDKELDSEEEWLSCLTKPKPVEDPLGVMLDTSNPYRMPRKGPNEDGQATLDLFLDRANEHSSAPHPALPSVMEQQDTSKAERAEKLRIQEDVFRLRSMRREGEIRREHLLNKAKMLQARANKHKAKAEYNMEQLASMWESKLKDELEKTGPLEEVCAALREELDAAHKERLAAFEVKMKPIIIRDGPSRKANYKIQAARLHYDIYSLTQRLRHTTLRAEHEEQRRERHEREVRRLREEISAKKTAISTVTKGVPFTKIEVRPEDQIPPPSFHQTPSGVTPKPSISLPYPLLPMPATPSVAAGALSEAQQRELSARLMRQMELAAAERLHGPGQAMEHMSTMPDKLPHTTLPRIANGHVPGSLGLKEAGSQQQQQQQPQTQQSRQVGQRPVKTLN